jgi:hypothetical protein
MNTLLINLYGAPCSGKSVKMLQLAVVGKMRRVFCELSAEVAKEYVVQHIPITAVSSATSKSSSPTPRL